MSKTGTRLMATALAVAAAFSIGVAHAADKVDLDAAKKEGKVVWYTSTPIETAPTRSPNCSRRDRREGRTVPLRRIGHPAPLHAGKSGRPHRRRRDDHLRPGRLGGARQEGMFVDFKPENFDKVPDSAKAADGAYVAQRLNMIVIYVRSDKVDKADYAQDLDRPALTPNTRASW